MALLAVAVALAFVALGDSSYEPPDVTEPRRRVVVALGADVDAPAFSMRRFTFCAPPPCAPAPLVVAVADCCACCCCGFGSLSAAAATRSAAPLLLLLLP